MCILNIHVILFQSNDTFHNEFVPSFPYYYLFVGGMYTWEYESVVIKKLQI
jgi:hypothetical protein